MRFAAPLAVFAALNAAALVGCESDDPSTAAAADDTSVVDTAPAPDTATSEDIDSADVAVAPEDVPVTEDVPDIVPVPGGVETASIVHSFGTLSLKPYQETQPCVAWTLNNDQPLYVQSVTLANDGAYHHSNWFVVPEDLFPGPDGFFKCSERNVQEIAAAIEGTVIFAQSTQSLDEVQRLPDGVVIKVPPRHKIIATTHLLNLSSEGKDTELRMGLDIIHPMRVKDITVPFRLTYFDLRIDPSAESHFTGHCDLKTEYEKSAGLPFDMKLYYVTPHYHYLGNYFEVSIIGGARDGEVLHTVERFDGEAHGRSFDPPVDLAGATGLSFTCGYLNPTLAEVGWGIGDQEMCVMLGLASSKVMMDAQVPAYTEKVGMEGEIILKEGPCVALAIPKNASQTPPTQEELDAALYVPATNETDIGVVPVKPCVDTPSDAVAKAPATLTAVRDTIFKPACSYTACHGGPKPAAGLSLDAQDLHAELMGHTVAANTDLPLVAPGSPDGSWLYHLLSKCAPVDQSGAVVYAMPRNAPVLMDPELVARVRDWIKAGAQND